MLNCLKFLSLTCWIVWSQYEVWTAEAPAAVLDCSESTEPEMFRDAVTLTQLQLKLLNT